MLHTSEISSSSTKSVIFIFFPFRTSFSVYPNFFDGRSQRPTMNIETIENEAAIISSKLCPSIFCPCGLSESPQPASGEPYAARPTEHSCWLNSPTTCSIHPAIRQFKHRLHEHNDWWFRCHVTCSNKSLTLRLAFFSVVVSNRTFDMEMRCSRSSTLLRMRRMFFVLTPGSLET